MRLDGQQGQQTMMNALGPSGIACQHVVHALMVQQYGPCLSLLHTFRCKGPLQQLSSLI